MARMSGRQQRGTEDRLSCQGVGAPTSNLERRCEGEGEKSMEWCSVFIVICVRLKKKNKSISVSLPELKQSAIFLEPMTERVCLSLAASLSSLSAACRGMVRFPGSATRFFLLGRLLKVILSHQSERVLQCPTSPALGTAWLGSQWARSVRATDRRSIRSSPSLSEESHPECMAVQVP